MRKSLIIYLVIVGITSVVHAQGRPGDVIDVSSVQCGDIIDDEFMNSVEYRRFTIELNPGDQLSISAAPLGERPTIRLAIADVNDTFIAYTVGSGNDRFAYPELAPSLTDVSISSSALHSIYVSNYSADLAFGEPFGANIESGDIGVYTLYIGCTLRGGMVIEPGASVPPLGDGSSGDVGSSVPAFSGYGFPGVNPVDFSAGIEIPLNLGQSQTAPIANDVVLYTYSASAGETTKLSVSRVSGDISIGVTVIKRDTNEIIFFGGLPLGNNLSVELTFPSDGTYAIGLFRLDTAERSGTSGAVQITLQ